MDYTIKRLEAFFMLFTFVGLFGIIIGAVIISSVMFWVSIISGLMMGFFIACYIWIKKIRKVTRQFGVIEMIPKLILFIYYSVLKFCGVGNFRNMSWEDFLNRDRKK